MSEKLFNFPTVTLIFTSFVLGLSEFIVLGISEDIASGLHENIDKIVLLITIFAWAYAIAAPVLTSVTAKMNRYRIFLLFFAVFLVANVISFFSTTYLVLALSRVITAAVSGVILAMALGYVPSVTAPQNIPKAIALVFAGFSIACTVGLPLGNVIVSSTHHWEYTFVAVIALSVIVLAMSVLSLPRENAQSNWGEQGPAPTGGMFTIVKDRRILLTMAFSIFGVGGAYVFFSAIQPLMNSFFDYDSTKVTIGLLCFGVFALISNVSSSTVAEKGGFRMLRWIALAQVVVFLVMPTALDIGWLTGMIMVMAMGLVMYLMNSANQMHYMEIAGKDYPQSVRLASSFNPMTFNFGIGIGAAVCSAMMSSGESFGTIGYVAAVVSLIALVAVFLIVRIEGDPAQQTSLLEGTAKGGDRQW